MTDPTRDLAARFHYRPDPYDAWTLLDEPFGPLVGDCEDFALTALWLLSGCSWWRLWWNVVTCQAMLWHVKAEATGDGHACLWFKGRGWIDNIYPSWQPKSPHRKRWPYIAPLLALVLILK